MSTLITVIVVLVVLLAVLAAASLKIIKQYEVGVLFRLGRVIGAVSYTHLTLPTNREV